MNYTAFFIPLLSCLPMQRINFWSSPRNISTALMYSFAQHPEVTVVDEPLYAAYLQRFPELVHPGREETLASQQPNVVSVIRNVLQSDTYTTPFVVFKQMTHHLEQLAWEFTLDMINILLIRDPRAIIASYSKVIPEPTAQDVGIMLQADLKAFLEQHGSLAAIVDSQELLLDPESVLRQLCDRIGLSFTPQMLQWDPGPRPEDGTWAKHWYRGVHQSTGFLPFQSKTYHLSPRQEQLAQQCLPIYEVLYKESIKAGKN